MKKRQLLILPILIFLALGLFFLVKNNDKKKVESQSSETSSFQTAEPLEQSVIEHSSATEVSYSYEKDALSTEELKKYREEIETAGFDSTLFSDQEIQAMLLKIDKSGQSVSDYLKDNHEQVVEESEIEKARKELKAADIDSDKFHNNEIVEFIKQAKKEKKSIVKVVKENKK